MNLCYAIKHYRKKVFPMRGGQAAFAAALGTTRQEVSAWENGKREPTLKNLRKIATVLNVTVNDLTNYPPNARARRSEEDLEYWRDLAIAYKEQIVLLQKEVETLKRKIKNGAQRKGKE